MNGVYRSIWQGFPMRFPRSYFKAHPRKIADEGLVTLVARALKAVLWWRGSRKDNQRLSSRVSAFADVVKYRAERTGPGVEKRGHRYCRWADDFLILLKSERAPSG